MKEVWKPIEGYEDYYEVSNTGRVRGKTRTVNYIDGRVKVFEAKEITPIPNTDGYVEETHIKPCVYIGLSHKLLFPTLIIIPR